MKKSLLTLAVLAASGAAMAQSSVTLYGLVDASIGQTKTGVGAASVTKTVLNSGEYSTSRFGLKGSKAVGAGLNANFQLEAFLAADTGTGAATGGFDRLSVVGLSGAFGTVNFGRQYNPLNAMRGAANSNADSNMAITGPVAKSLGGAVPDYTLRIANSIGYTSPDFNGLTANVLVGQGEDNDKSFSKKASIITALTAVYKKGPLVVGFGYDSDKSEGLAATTTPVAAAVAPSTLTHTLVNAAYDFGPVRINGGYERANKNTTNATDTEVYAGLTMPVGSAAKVYFGYAKTKGDANGVKTDGNGFAITATYDLFKDTNLWAGWNKVQAQNAAGTTTQDDSRMMVGVRHFF